MSRRHDLSTLLTDPEDSLGHPDSSVRRIAVAASLEHSDLHGRLIEMLAHDPDPSVRRECAEVLGLARADVRTALEAAVTDQVAEVREAAVTALGELADPASLDLLLETVGTQDEDKLVREAAVAALGAIGDYRAVPILLDLIADGPPQIRRRCAAALSVFDGDDVDQALHAAATDRNPMVREAAEMVVGRSTS